MDLSACDLAGTRVLVTRAEEQAEGLCQLIADLNGRPLRFPCIEICASEDDAHLADVRLRIEQADMAIFISANAVRYGLQQLSGGRLPGQVKIAAVGMATAQALTDSGHKVAIVPAQGFDSEALLRCPEMSAERLMGKRILIFRGQDGRELLRETLGRRGAQVEYAEVYQRRCPPPVADLEWLSVLDVVTATSNNILDNLFQLIGDRFKQRLQRLPLIVISERMRDHAQALGCHQVMLAAGPDDRSLVEALCQWFINR